MRLGIDFLGLIHISFTTSLGLILYPTFGMRILMKKHKQVTHDVLKQISDKLWDEVSGELRIEIIDRHSEAVDLLYIQLKERVIGQLGDESSYD